MKVKNAVFWIICIILIAVFLVASYKIITYYLEGKKANDYYASLRQEVTPDTSGESQDAEQDASESNDSHDKGSVLDKYEKLHKKNPDFFGWLRIDDTPIDYPVMYTPLDSEYYLRRDFDGKYLYSGLPFIDGACLADGNYYLVYGHHMRNKTMFGTLPYYKDKEYWEEHKTVHFDTLYEERTYKVMAAFYSKIYSGPQDVFQYYIYCDLSDPDVFAEYVDGVQSVALYDTGITAQYGDELLALSTCNYHTSDGRFVIVAKRIKK